MGMRKLLLLFFFTLFLINLVSADISVDINVKDSFTDGERVKFDYEILSDSDLNITYAPSILCENSPIPLTERENVKLDKNEILEGEYEDFLITDLVGPKECYAIVSLFQPFEESYEESFVIDTLPFCSSKLSVGSDKNLEGIQKKYEVGDTLFISGSNIVTSLTLPDKSTVFVGDSILLEVPGTYFLDYSFVGDNCKKVDRNPIKFSVVDHSVVSPQVGEISIEEPQSEEIKEELSKKVIVIKKEKKNIFEIIWDFFF